MSDEKVREYERARMAYDEAADAYRIAKHMFFSAQRRLAAARYEVEISDHAEESRQRLIASVQK